MLLVAVVILLIEVTHQIDHRDSEIRQEMAEGRDHLHDHHQAHGRKVVEVEAVATLEMMTEELLEIQETDHQIDHLVEDLEDHQETEMVMRVMMETETKDKAIHHGSSGVRDRRVTALMVQMLPRKTVVCSRRHLLEMRGCEHC